MRKVYLARGNSARLSVVFILGLTFMSGVAVAEKRVGEGTALVFTAQNDAGAEALKLLQEGLRLYNEGTAESLQQALQVLERARQLFRETRTTEAEATVLLMMGRIFNDLGDNQQALDYSAGALPLFRAVANRAGEATILNNIGAVYNILGEKQKALDYYNQALPIFREVGNRAGEAMVLNNLGIIYNDLGEKQKALEYYRQALPSYQERSDRTGEATILNNLGGVYDTVGEKQKALDYYNQALSLRRAMGDRRGEAGTLNNIGSVYNDLGEKQKALDYYHQALSIGRAVGDRAGEAATLNNLGNVYNDLGEKRKALGYHNEALSIGRAVGDRAGEAASLNNLGWVYFSLDEKQKALNYYNQALPLIRAVGDRSGEATTLKHLTYLNIALGDVATAFQNINAAITLIEDLRTKIGSDDLRTSYFATVQDYYQFKIDLLMGLGQPQEAFNTSERSRARTLLELLNTAAVDFRQGADPQLLERERQLRQQLQEVEARRLYLLSREYTQQQAAALDRESDTLLGELQQLLAQIRRTHPAYANLRQPQPLTLNQIQQQVLDPETVLLQYALGEERSYLWVVSSDGFNSYELPGSKDLAKPIAQFHNAISHPGSPPSDIKRKGDPLVELILPKPVWAQIAGKRLLVVANGDLQTIPFAALPLLNTPEYTPLLKNHEILTQPSASSIAISRQQLQGRTPAPKTLAILADPVYRSDDPRVTGETVAQLPIEIASTLRSLDLSAVQRLPNTRTEAEQILALVPDSDRVVAFDFAADYDWATNPQLSQYRIVHFATHGFVNPVNPALSGVVLSLVDERGRAREEGLLRLHDIFNLNLPAELVVLSACQTGLGEEVRGEGLIGLTRGFMFAGAKRLVVSLWNVNDEATVTLMTAFFRKILQDNMTPAVAMRAAQLEMWEAGLSPNLWAAFTVQGEWRD